MMGEREPQEPIDDKTRLACHLDLLANPHHVESDTRNYMRWATIMVDAGWHFQAAEPRAVQPATRLLELAREAAKRLHWKAHGTWSHRELTEDQSVDGHTFHRSAEDRWGGGIRTCQHPDCVLVRAEVRP